MYDLQKASFLKRISAYVLDFILLMILAVGFMSLFTSIFGYDTHYEKMQSYYAEYESTYGIDMDISAEEYDALTEEKKAAYTDAQKAMSEDEALIETFSMVISLTMLTITLGLLCAYLILDFAVPLLFKNGQTVGKKVFGIGVMQVTGVRISAVALFVRTVLGKYAVETMVLVFTAITVYFNIGNVFYLILSLGIAIGQIAALIVTRNNMALHDLMASTVTVDLASQMIFDSKEALLEYKKQAQAQKAEKAKYF